MITVGLRHPSSGAFAPVDEDAWCDLRSPLGAQLGDGSTTFAVYSKHAERVLLEIFDRVTGEEAWHDYWMQQGRDDVWRAKIAGVPAGTLYGFRCWGPNWTFSEDWRRGNSIHGFLTDVDNQGNRFNPNKLLFDPYARELSHDREVPELRDAGHHGEMYGSGAGLYSGFGSEPVVRRTFDTGPWAPKSVVIDDRTSFGDKPRILEKDLVIYEVHVRGLTRHPSSSRLTQILAGIDGFEDVADVLPGERGSYRAAGVAAKYLKALGCNAVELLPVHEAANALSPDGELSSDRAADEPPHGTYWGYMTYGYFAPERRYALDRSLGGPTREFKEMVRAFHEHGIAVILDVVFNHSAEGGLWGGDPNSAELLFLRGLDNAEYYALVGEGRRFYWESTGCGNNLDASKPAVRRLILDSLIYWSDVMGVDGFRFDLATVLGREATFDYRFSGGSKLLTAIRELAEERRFTVIAEAWDTQFDGGYQVGNFPPGWAEWNGRYRDAVRRFSKGDPYQLQSFMSVINGDYAAFADQGGPQKSVNFVTAHDGFTLLDLVSYNHKNNGELWPFGPSDGGADQNDSWDSGGDKSLRRQRLRNFVALLLLSRGVPMLRGGDEFGQTQNGNNNPYKLDSVATWLNYAMIGAGAPTRVPTEGGGAYHDNYGAPDPAPSKNGLFSFTRFLLGLRAAHASLRQDRYADAVIDGGSDVTYLFKKEDGRSDLAGYERALSLCINGREVGDVDFLVFINMHDSEVGFRFPDAVGWLRLVDTASWAESNANVWVPAAASRFETGGEYRLHPFTLAVFRSAD